MHTNLGYQNSLFILPFDHRSTFQKHMFQADNRALTPQETEEIKDMKGLIYEAFKKSLTVIPKQDAAILVDEEYGDAVLQDAGSQGYVTILTTEKSGQEIFDFEYQDAFMVHIEKYHPTFAKALVRYNPEGDETKNAITRQHLKVLSDFCHENGYKFLIEPLVPPTEVQLQKVSGDKEAYDTKFRPVLEVAMIKALQEAGIEPDVWKIEGLRNTKDYENLLKQARVNGRDNVGVVILGRGAGDEEVSLWIREGAKIPGVIGFAVGRTIFWEALVAFHQKTLSREQAIENISQNYIKFYQVFVDSRNQSA